MSKENGIKEELKEPLVLYVVRNSSGQFYRSKGYGGYGSSWVDSINKAKIYGKPSGARGVITFFSKNYPGFPTPDLIKLTVSDVLVMDEKSRVEKAKKKIATAAEKRELRMAKDSLRIAEERKRKAEEDLKKAKAYLESRKEKG
jgi:hypothetical protein